MTDSSKKGIDIKEILEGFKNLNPNDIGAWPLAPRVVVLVVLFIAILIGAWFLLWGPQVEALDIKRKEQEQLFGEWEDKQKQAIKMEGLIKQKAEVDAELAGLLKLLPKKTQIEDLLVKINQSGLGRGLQFELFKPGSESPKDIYAELPISLKLSGSYHALGAFASDIGRLPQIVNLTGMSLTPAAAGVLTLDVNALTYRALEEEEKTKSKPVKKGG